MELQKIAEMVQQACLDTEGSEDEVSFYNNYSGRGMYGNRCVGITGSERACNRLIAEVIKDMVGVS